MGTKDASPSIDRAEVLALMERIETWTLVPEDGPQLHELLGLLLMLAVALDSTKITIQKLQKMIFGPRSETRPTATATAPESPVVGDVAAAATSGSDAAQTGGGEAPPPKKRPGHGRLPASLYTGATRVACLNTALHPGDRCPQCFGFGRLYDTNEPGIVLKMTGQPIVTATIFERQTLRCSSCLSREQAPLPEGVSDQKWDPTADVAITVQKYAGGMPFYRLERLQADVGVPLPSSTAFERCEHVADCLHPVFLLLKRLASGAEVFTIDDTTVRILDLMRENKTLAEDERRGMFTTGVLAQVDGHTIALYFSGRNHAGENLGSLLANRSVTCEPAITMADALSRNWPPGFTLLVAKCLVHGRRQFVDIESSFPGECKQVLDELAKVFHFDGQTAGMGAAERLLYHQEHSAPVMEALRLWIDEQLERAEPNGPLKPALTYFKKHWKDLTLFLRDGRSPLDSNAVERALKLAVLNRKNSYFYRSQHGADVGDLVLSVIQTCRLSGTNVWAYLVDAVRHKDAVRAAPGQWLPWVWAERQKAPATKAA